MSQYPSEADLADAEQCFAQAINYVERHRWEDAANALQDTLQLAPNFPHASRLLAHVGNIRQAIMGGQDERPQIDALRAIIASLNEAGDFPTISSPLVPVASTGLVLLPWDDDEPAPALHPIAMKSTAASAPSVSARQIVDLPHLSPLNPFAGVQVLIWFFLRPVVLKLYAHEGRSDELQRVTGWLASTILWLPLAIPVAAFIFGSLPSPWEGHDIAWMLAVILILWAVSGWLAVHDHTQFALILAAAVWVMIMPLFLAQFGIRSGGLIGLIFLLMAGYAAGIAGLNASRSAAHLALGATYVTTVAAVYKMYVFITPIVENYVAGFILGPVGGPILIMLAVLGTGLFTLGMSYVIPYLGTYFVSFGVEAVLEDNLTTGFSPLGAAALTGMIACFIVLAWLCFAGGWQFVQRL
jgi:hypothetical protein